MQTWGYGEDGLLSTGERNKLSSAQLFQGSEVCTDAEGSNDVQFGARCGWKCSVGKDCFACTTSYS